MKGIFLSAYDVFYALWPGKLIVFKIHIENQLGPGAWDPVVTRLLALPLWALFGVPGALLVWLGRSHPADDEIDAIEQSLYLYDSLAKQAKEEGLASDPIGDLEGNRLEKRD